MIFRFNAISIKTPVIFFTGIEKNPTIHIKVEKTMEPKQSRGKKGI
jgi:hypothetical protein